MGPILFNIFINNIDSGIEPSASLKMTPKLGGALDSLEENYAMQKDLDRLGKRTHEKLLKLNRAKYRFMHVGWGNPHYQYRLGAEWIESIPAEKGFGVLADEIFNMRC